MLEEDPLLLMLLLWEVEEVEELCGMLLLVLEDAGMLEEDPWLLTLLLWDGEVDEVCELLFWAVEDDEEVCELLRLLLEEEMDPILIAKALSGVEGVDAYEAVEFFKLQLLLSGAYVNAVQAVPSENVRLSHIAAQASRLLVVFCWFQF